MGKMVDLEEGLELVQKGITKLTNILEGRTEQSFTIGERVMLYTTIFDLATREHPHNHSQVLYDKYRESLEEYLTSEVLPALSEKHNEFMLLELSLLTCLRQLVYQLVKDEARDTVISLIHREGEGEQVDKTLLKNVLKVFLEIGSGKTRYYETDFEAHMLRETSTYYSQKASIWIVEDSCPDYMLKAEECLKREKDRVLHYLHRTSEPKLLQITGPPIWSTRHEEQVEDEILSAYANQLLENETSGCHVLFRDKKVDDLSRMCRLFYKIPSGMNLISEIFKQHVTAEFTVLVRSVIELNSKYLALSNDCFQSNSPLLTPLEEVFEVFCNKGFSGDSSVELLASLWDNTLKKGGTKNPSEAVEETIEKDSSYVDITLSQTVKLLALHQRERLCLPNSIEKKLNRRLLFDRSANGDCERSMLTKLKRQFGWGLKATWNGRWRAWLVGSFILIPYDLID
ncbi:hypothetical protein OPV22_026354 [Ensete ventricosum]|uniref:Cullin N-terminal domain-containing protein n=1 Tax=Ensete ventricosum TaxID=4639 RepID=A0AAV8Q9Z6_ENSVE|nr:hypothetical protein OPV22_026354 [Ensete ventricosum]